MGLLLGNTETDESGDEVSNIWSVSILQRSDKRADRVEISPEQLAMAAEEAHALGGEMGRETRVIGWYHSHPKITVQPSHVDLRTQMMYQQLDQSFIGLIFSVFNQEKDSNHRGKMQVIAFQSIDQDTAEKHRQQARLSSTSASASSSSSSTQADLLDDIMPVYSDHEQVDIPLLVVNTLPTPPDLFQKIVQLQESLYKEAREAYQSAVQEQRGQLFGALHCSAVYQKALCRLLEFGIAPVMAMLDDYTANLY